MNRKHRKRALCALIVCVLALQLCGCGASKPAASSEAPNVTVMPTPSEPAAAVHAVNLMASVTPNRGEAKPMTNEEQAAAADFALRLFRAGNKGDKNTLLSPLSVLSALAMTANGAEGETLAQMENTLGMSKDRLNAYFLAYLEALEGDKSLKSANSIWFTSDPRFTVNQSFLQTNADFYGADIYSAPLDGQTLNDINDWIKEKTDGMIPKMLDKISPAAVMYLVNALAFDAKWAVPYAEYAVQSGEFTCADGTKRTVDFLHGEEHQYLEDEKAVGFLKPYEGGKYAFVALLPKEGVSVEDYLASLDGASLQKLLENVSWETVYTSLPKFETAYGTELGSVLKEMGMVLPFDDEQADFSGLGTSTAGNIFISRVLHKTFISVNEQGTRAGAATVVEMTDGAMLIEDPKEVYLDRPFVYMLIDTETNLPFFIGTMLDPAK